MCGIAGFMIGPDCRTFTANPLAMERFANELMLGIEHRGKDATGFLSLSADTMRHQRAACKATAFIRERAPLTPSPRAVLLHTRYATQGHEGFIENNHPVVHNGVYVTHNGHISNDDELFAGVTTERLGRVDSEVIPALLSHEDWTIDGVRSVMEKLDGSFAVAAAHPKHQEMYLIRGNGSPLFVIQARGGFMAWASEEVTLESAWNEVFGTPPSKASIERIPEGTILRCLDGEVVERVRFAPIERYITYTNGNFKYTSTTFPKTAAAQKAWVNGEEIELDTERGLWDALDDQEREDWGSPLPFAPAQSELVRCSDCQVTSEQDLRDFFEFDGDDYCTECALWIEKELTVQTRKIARLGADGGY